MQNNAISKIQGWLPAINPCQLELEKNPGEENYCKKLNQIIEKIHSWAISVLEKAGLPLALNEAKLLLENYAADTDEACAIHAMIELHAMRTSIRNTDANTAAIASMKLFEVLWQHAATKTRRSNPLTTKQGNTNNQGVLSVEKNDNEEDIKLYQDTINELKNKYPHCNVNALRLLASTRLNVTKQQLDDLEISPQ